MITFWLFLFGILIGYILYKLVQLFPKTNRVISCLLYTIDIYIIFTFSNCLVQYPTLFTSFVIGAITSQMFFIITTNYTDIPYIYTKNNTRFPYPDLANPVGCRFK